MAQSDRLVKMYDLTFTVRPICRWADKHGSYEALQVWNSGDYSHLAELRVYDDGRVYHAYADGWSVDSLFVDVLQKYFDMMRAEFVTWCKARSVNPVDYPDRVRLVRCGGVVC